MKNQFRPSVPFQNKQNAQLNAFPINQVAVLEEDTMQLASVQKPPAAIPNNTRGRLSTSVQHILKSGLTQLQDPQPEGMSTRGFKAVKVGKYTLGMFPILMLFNASGLLMVSFSYYVSILQYGNTALEFFFLIGLLFMFVPTLLRLLSPTPTRLERLLILCSLGIALYIVRFLASPHRFSEYDEFLNWRTADTMLKTGHLFGENSLLPVGPFYPGLQLLANAVSTMSGSNTFHAAIIIISLSRLLMVLALFLFFEQLTKSSRMAGIASIIYMVNPHFLFFDSIFSYESLALPLATFMFYLLTRYQPIGKSYRWAIFLASLVLLAVTATHHLTDFFFDGLLVIWAVISLFQASSRHMRRNLVTIAFYAALLSFAYTFLLKGNPVWHYLDGIFGTAFDELGHIFAGTSTPRPLFVSSPGAQLSIWDRLLMAASVALVTLGLPFGLLSLWQQYRHDAISLMFGILSFAYPITQVFRITNFGSDIADRSAAFLFLPIAFVLTILITHLWPTRKLTWRATSFVTCMIAVVFMGGVILDSGPGWRALPGPYVVIADERSIEPVGLQAAAWSLAYLGPNNRVGTDRINQIIMGTFGDQRIVTSQQDGVEIAPVFFSSQLDAEDRAILQASKVRYLIVDLRLSSSIPLQGFYFGSDEIGAYHYTVPISNVALTKFSTIAQINRFFDSGNIVIYDVGALSVDTSH